MLLASAGLVLGRLLQVALVISSPSCDIIERRAEVASIREIDKIH